MMIRHGYIDDNYFDYVSLFHEGSLTKNDNDFLINLKLQSLLEFDFRLCNYENLIKRIDISYFETPAILNYGLLDFMMGKTEHDSKLEKIFVVLSNSSDYSMRFIDGFINYEITNLALFINRLAYTWKLFWDYIMKNNHLNEVYFKLLIEYASLDSLEAQSNNSSLVKDIVARDDFFTIINDKQKIRKIVGKFNIKFVCLDTALSNDDFEWVYTSNFYELNIKMLEFILSRKQCFDKKKFHTQNYSFILESGCNELIQYINENIAEYIEKVYLKIDTNIDETEENLLMLLNNRNISVEAKEKIIQKMNTKLSELNRISDVEIKRLIIKNSRVLPIWSVILNFFHEEENILTDEILLYLEDEENTTILTGKKIDKDIPDQETASIFIRQLVIDNKLSINIYQLLLKSVPYWYDDLDLTQFNKERILMLINSYILQPSAINFTKLKERFNPLHITLLEKCNKQLIEHWEEFPFEPSDYCALFDSEKLSLDQKHFIYEKIGDDAIIANTDILLIVAKLILKNDAFKIILKMFVAILLQSSLTMQDKIELFCKRPHYILNREQIISFLNILGEPYSTINDGKYRYILPKNETTEKIVSTLRMRGFISSWRAKGDQIIINKHRKK